MVALRYGGYFDESSRYTIYGSSFASARCTGIIAAISSLMNGADTCSIKKVFLDRAIDNPKLEGRVKNRREIIINVQEISD